MTETPVPYPCGLRIYLRSQMPNGDLHFHTLLDGRAVVQEDRDWPFFNVYGEGNKFLGAFNLEAVAFVLPLNTIGPAS